MNRFTLAASISALALVCATAGWAQPNPETTPLRVGEEISGRLDGSDPTGGSDGGEYRFEDFEFVGRAGARLEAIMRSDDFDAYLEVFRADDLSTSLFSDDDGLGEATNSRLRFVLPGSGPYILRARTLIGTEGGEYRLELRQRPRAPRAPRPAAVRKGSAVAGSLGPRDPETDEGTPYDAFSLRLGEGERVSISLMSDAFDPVVSIGRFDRGNFTELAQNDDRPGGGLDSLLIFTAPTAGDYVVRASGLGTESQGSYTLLVNDGPPPLAAKPISIGAEVTGELTDDDGSNDAGQRADAFSFFATAGQRVSIALDSNAFDAYLQLFGPDGKSLGEDDDGGDEGTNSRLIRTLAESGTYIVQARSLGDGGLGSYTLKIEEAAPAPEPDMIGFGQTLQGEIRSGGARDDEGRNFVAYRFEGREGDRVQVVLRSGDFDTFVQLGLRADPFQMLASDDDGLGEGTDSRLTFRLPSTAEYEIRASPLGAEEKGLFSIELIDRGPQPLPGSILVGASARASLTDNDALTDEGIFYDDYRIEVAEGDKLIVTMVSNDFDAFIDVGREVQGGLFESIASDDDSLSDTHAKVDWTVEQAGSYLIRARSFARGQTGSYTLAVERKP